MKCALVIALALLAACAHAAGEEELLRTVISLEGSTIHYEISAVGGDVTLLSWGTPLEESFQERFLRISGAGEGQRQQWTSRSMAVKRMRPTEEHYATIAAGSSVVGSIAVGEHYAIHAEGTYLFRLEFPVVLQDGTRAVSISNEVALEVTEAEARPTRPARSVDTVFFNGCSANEMTQINAAIVDATTATEDALEYLDANGSCIDDYVQWFGTYSSSRFAAVDGAYEAVLAQFESTDFGFDCTCNDPFTFAFVFIDDSTYTINLCGAFWDAPSGRGNIDSQPGTLVHEMSHFTAVYGSEDFQYGVANCTQLAIDNPSQAINNADSLEYFTESNPTCASSCGDDVCTGVEAQTCQADCSVPDPSPTPVTYSPNTVSYSPNTVSYSPNTVSYSPNTVSYSPNTVSYSPNTVSDSTDSSSSGGSNSNNGSDDDDDSNNDDDSASAALSASAAAALLAACLVIAL